MGGVKYEYPQTRKKILQVVPVLFGYLIGISFGMMLGWSSHAYPFLMGDESPIPIRLNQTALITSFLWKGNCLGAFFSTSKRLGAKHGVLLAATLELAGWFVMCCAGNLTEILISRFLIGMGNGFGIGQLKIYIRDTCEQDIAAKLNTYLALTSPIGILFTFVLSALVSFRTVSVVCTVFPFIALVLFGFIPKKPRYMENKRVAVIRNIIDPVKTEKIMEVTKTYRHYTIEDQQLGVFEALSDSSIRHSMLIVTILVVVQRVSGGPPHIIFAELIYREAENPYPQICVIVYGFVFLVMTTISLQFTQRFSKKILLVSSFSITSFLMMLMTLFFYYKNDVLQLNRNFSWLPLVIALSFNVVHTFGIRTVSLLIIKDIFPANAKDFAGGVYITVFSLSALLITKSFQELYYHYGVHAGYVLMTSVAGASAVFIAIFYKQSLPEDESQKKDNGSNKDDKDKNVSIYITKF
ncbi:sugar transport protein MST7-like [Agrilus planipennis]|uniref:Sugar transport protein MST7-like n=1 Tax=Agrilus planipennis TaxID=224129 RepID=A0A1W4W4F7_AGRPL|nr:sugar transport protein MST7-like [Agrilus planipennis]